MWKLEEVQIDRLFKKITQHIIQPPACWRGKCLKPNKRRSRVDPTVIYIWYIIESINNMSCLTLLCCWNMLFDMYYFQFSKRWNMKHYMVKLWVLVDILYIVIIQANLLNTQRHLSIWSYAIKILLMYYIWLCILLSPFGGWIPPPNQVHR